jgi:1-phosphatidylinositol-4-phosphate 5-kinase
VSLYYSASAPNAELKTEDMLAVDNYLFPPQGCKKAGLPATPKHNLSHTFKFKDYSPKVFHRLRLLSGIDTESYMNSVCGDANFYSFTTNSKRSVFFLS